MIPTPMCRTDSLARNEYDRNEPVSIPTRTFDAKPDTSCTGRDCRLKVVLFSIFSKPIYCRMKHQPL
jgi:hypothetical protein